MRRRRSPRARGIAWILAASLVVSVGLVRWKGGPSPAGSAIRRVERVDPPAQTRPTEPAREAPHRGSSSASLPTASPPGVAPVAGGAGTTPPVVDLATLAHDGAPKRTVDGDRFRTNDTFTAEDLAHPERYFEAAEHLPELQRDEERRDALDYFLAYRAQLEHDLGVAGMDGDRRAAVLAVIERYDAAIARLQSALATASP